MYSVSAYHRMIADKTRRAAYVRALQKTVSPKTTVLEIGTGIGFFAMVACRLGARAVKAVDPSDAIQIARQLASQNGFGKRIDFIQALSTELDLQERADVIISDLRGILPFFENHLPSIIDARKRLLAPGGVLIPARDTVNVAVIEVPKFYAKYADSDIKNSFGLDMERLRDYLLNTTSKIRHPKKRILLEPKVWAILNYKTLESPDADFSLTWVSKRKGTAHGFSIWFDSLLAENVFLSNAPFRKELIYGSGFLPLLKPIPIEPGDTLTLRLNANLVNEDYIWRWETKVLKKGNPKKIKANFVQSTFFGVPLSKKNVSKRSADYMPQMTEDADVDVFILKLMYEELVLGEIARRLCAKFPSRFPTWESALNKVGELSLKYSD